MSRARFFIVIFAVAALFGFYNLERSFAGSFGVTPPFLNASHLVQGARYVQVIYLVQDDPSQDLKVDANLRVNERIKPWFTINGNEEIIIPKGMRQFPLEIVVQVPRDAGLGVYQGTLSIATMPAQEGQVTIAPGALIAVNLTVGNDIFRQFNIPVVSFLQIEEGWSPRVAVKINNEGNVPEMFDKAIFNLYDQFSATRLAYIPKNQGFPEVPPFSFKEIIIEFPTTFYLGVGEYWGDVTFYQNEKVVRADKGVFKVLPKGSLSTPLEQALRAVFDYWYIPAIIVVGLLWSIFRFFRKRRKRGNAYA